MTVHFPTTNHTLTIDDVVAMGSTPRHAFAPLLGSQAYGICSAGAFATTAEAKHHHNQALAAVARIRHK